MKIECKLDGKDTFREVYKVQVSLFGGPSILIYNEDRTQLYQVHSTIEIKAIQKFIGKNKVKVYVAGYQNEDGQIVMEKVIPDKISRRYDW